MNFVRFDAIHDNSDASVPFSPPHARYPTDCVVQLLLGSIITCGIRSVHIPNVRMTFPVTVCCVGPLANAFAR